jgi:hypothetical protein
MSNLTVNNNYDDLGLKIVYLIQPSEFCDTNRYKVGCSVKQGINRIYSGYSKNTKILHVSKCGKPEELEKLILAEFNKKFKLFKGKEYFEGNEKEIINTFKTIITTYETSLKQLTKNNNLNYKFPCQKCDKIFNHKQSRWRHEKTCNSTSIIDIKQENELLKQKLELNKQKYETEINMIKEEIKLLKNQTINNQINNGPINTLNNETINNTTNIKIIKLVSKNLIDLLTDMFSMPF